MCLPLPLTLSPSKVDRFTHCPLSFRFAYIDRLPEPSSIDQVRGTLVHSVLELLFVENQKFDRTLDRGLDLVEKAWQGLVDGPEVESLHLDNAGQAKMLREARSLVGKYFSMEDPSTVTDIARELDLRIEFNGIELRGIIDRLDKTSDGDFVVVDYKTGRAPRDEQSQARLAGVNFYSYLCEKVYGHRPIEVKLLYLRDQVVVSSKPSDQSTKALCQRLLAIWSAIERACASGDFRPSPSGLCKTCNFKDVCPAFGGIAPRPTKSAEADQDIAV